MGRPIVLVVTELGGWVHAGVEIPDGQILDLEGLHDPDAWLDQWAPFLAGDTPTGEAWIRPLTDVIGHERYREIEKPDPDVAAAARLQADLLLARLDLRPSHPCSLLFTSVHD